jgi:glycosyltransferase involved in cell wall biosynthesis
VTFDWLLIPFFNNWRITPLKIAFINQPWSVVSPPVQNADSVATWTYEVSSRLSKDCAIVSYCKQHKSQAKCEMYRGIEYRRISLIPDRIFLKILRELSKIVPISPSPLFNSTLYHFWYILAIALDLRRQNCDLVHIHNLSHFVPIVRAFNPKIKIVLHMHSEWLTQLQPTTIARRLRKTDAILGCSEHVTDKVRQKFPAFASRCHTVFNGVDLDRFRPPEKPRDRLPKTLIFVGRISPEKGVHVLLEAFRQVVERYREVNLQIVGPKGSTPREFIVDLSDDPEVQKLDIFYEKNYATYLDSLITEKIADRVSFPGSVSHSELAEFYRESDILINPSLTEAFGMSLIEAMATELPAIVTCIGGMPEVIEEGKTGLFCHAGDPDSLAAAILKLLEDDRLRTSMGTAGRERVLKLFSWDRVSERVWNVYQSLQQKND